MSNEILWLPIEEAIARFHPENPREHTEENDLPWIRESLLDFGWLTYPTIQRNLDNSLGYLISGHGRIQGAEWLSQQDAEFFLSEWNRWLKATGRDKIAAKHQGRFTSDYWSNIPAVPVTLDELSQKSALLRLNNTSHDGRDDPGKIAAILAQMPKKQIKAAGWDVNTAKNFMNAFLVRKEEEPEEEAEFQDSQTFEHSDATDYGTGEAIAHDAPTDTYDDYAPPPEAELASVDTAEIGEVEAISNINYTAKGEQVQFFVFLEKEELPKFKDKLGAIASKLGIPTEGSIQQWRSQAILKAVDYILGLPDESASTETPEV